MTVVADKSIEVGRLKDKNNTKVFVGPNRYGEMFFYYFDPENNRKTLLVAEEHELNTIGDSIRNYTNCRRCGITYRNNVDHYCRYNGDYR